MAYSYTFTDLIINYTLSVFQGTLSLDTWLLNEVVDDDIVVKVPTGTFHKAQSISPQDATTIYTLGL